MPQTRIADDVWTLAEQVSDRMGLNSPRLAIEAIVRVCASHYTSNSLQYHTSEPVPAQLAKPVQLVKEPIAFTETDAASELSNLLQSL